MKATDTTKRVSKVIVKGLTSQDGMIQEAQELYDYVKGMKDTFERMDLLENFVSISKQDLIRLVSFLIEDSMGIRETLDSTRAGIRRNLPQGERIKLLLKTLRECRDESQEIQRTLTESGNPSGLNLLSITEHLEESLRFGEYIEIPEQD
jgi:hypothetical protein